jgi:enoyl-CoA hydratase/carnithine racemase
VADQALTPVRASIDGRGVATVTLARPPLNLLEPGLIAALREAFEKLNADEAVRVAVVQSEGRAFSAGMDVKIFRGLDPAGARRLIESLRDAIDAAHRAPFPTIAAVHGACLGGSFELVLACDLRVAAEDAIFGLPEVRVGLPSVIHAALLPRLLAPAVAAELLFAGTTIDAPAALGLGLVNRVAPPDGLTATTEALVEALLQAAPEAVRAQKQLIARWRDASTAEAVDLSVDAFARSFETGEPREGAEAFLEKRPPRWAPPKAQ